MNRIVVDRSEGTKVAIFGCLTRIAVSHDIALIFEWWRIMDPMRGSMRVQYQSFGFPEGPTNCVLCGGSQPNTEGDRELVESRMHRKCLDDAKEDGEEPSFLVPNSFRPAVIFMSSTCPGSIDNAIVRVAWGIGMHFWLKRCPSASFEWLDKAARPYGMDLVSRILEGRGIPLLM